MVNWLSKAAPFVLDPNLAKPITRLSASWHEKLGLWLFPSMALEEIEFWFEEYWGSILLRRADSSEDLGVVGAEESLTLSRVAAQVIVLFHDQKIGWFYYLMMIKWSDDCNNQWSQLWSPLWGGEFRGLFEGWHGSWDDCIILYHHQMIMIILSEDDQMVVQLY